MRKLTDKHDLKHLDDKGSQTAAQNRLSPLKHPQVWMPISLWATVVISLILFKVEGQPFQWKVDAREWTGFGQSYDNDVSEVMEKGTETTGTTTKTTDKTTTTKKRLQSAKTLWDWMTLLLAPATLAGLGFLFQSSQEKAKRDKAEADEARVADQQREQALQTYLDQLSALLVDKHLKRLLPTKQATVATNAPMSKGADGSIATEAVTAKPEMSIDAEAALDVVKARTLALLRMFDEDIPRKASVLSFLGDADLLNQLDLDLIFTRLNGANLKKVNFSDCNLSGANLQNAILITANLSGAKLHNTNLSGANLSGAKLHNTDLSGANLSGANLHDVNSSGANFNKADLSDANLSGADFSDTDLCGANLSKLALRSTLLIRADLQCANLRDADFSGTFLDCANLRDAILIGAFFLGTDLIGF